MTRLGVVALGSFVFAACSSATPPVTPPGPDFSAYTLGSEPAKYRVASVRKNQTEALGQATSLNSRLLFNTTVTITGLGADRRIEILVDSVLAAEGQMFMGGSRAAATGATIRGRVSSQGQLTDWELDPIGLADDPIIGQISAAYRQYFPRVPSSGVVPGSVWTDTTTFIRQQDAAEIVLEAVTEFRAGDWSDTTATAELTVQWVRNYSVSGAGEQMGQTFTVSGAGRSEGQHTFRADGLYLGTHMRDSSSSDIDVTSLGLAVPLTQTGVDSVTIRP